MRGAFVIRLGPETKPFQGLFEGWAEEVDSHQEIRFRSTEQLLRFLGDRFHAASGTDVNKSDKQQTDTSSQGTEP
jgi:hypothetical protein